MDYPGLGIDAVHGVALAQNKIQVAFWIQIHRARLIEGRARDWRAIGRRLFFACSGVSADEAGLEIDAADAVVSNVADQQRATGIEGQTVGLLELGLRGRAAVTGKSGRSVAGYCGDDLRLRLYPSADVVLHFYEEHVARFVETNFVWLVQQSLNSRTAVARVAFGSATRDRREAMRLHIEPPAAVVPDLTEVKRAVRPDDETVRIIGLSLDARAAVAGKASNAGSGDGSNRLRGSAEEQGQKQGCDKTHRVHYIRGHPDTVIQ